MVVCEVGRRMALRVFVAPARDEAKRHQRVVLGRSEWAVRWSVWWWWKGKDMSEVAARSDGGGLKRQQQHHLRPTWIARQDNSFHISLS